MSRLIWIYVVCKSILLSPMAVKEQMRLFLGNGIFNLHMGVSFSLHKYLQYGWTVYCIRIHPASYDSGACSDPENVYPNCGTNSRPQATESSALNTALQDSYSIPKCL